MKMLFSHFLLLYLSIFVLDCSGIQRQPTMSRTSGYYPVAFEAILTGSQNPHVSTCVLVYLATEHVQEELVQKKG